MVTKWPVAMAKKFPSDQTTEFEEKAMPPKAQAENVMPS